MRGAARPILALLVVAASGGCQGTLVAEGPADPPVVLLDGAGPSSDASTPPPADAGPPSMSDAGAPGSDAGPPPTPDAGPPPPPPPPPGCGNAIEAEELALTNDARRSAGLGELVCDDALTRAARLHSQDMCDQRYFAHDSLDGRTFVDRIRAEGATYRTAGENIARGQRTPAAVHDAWMNSPGHRANILNGAYGRIGIGYVECPGYGPLWTQDFTD